TWPKHERASAGELNGQRGWQHSSLFDNPGKCDRKICVQDVRKRNSRKSSIALSALRMSIFAKSVNITGRLSNTIGPSESLHSPEFCRITGVLQTDQIVTPANARLPQLRRKLCKNLCKTEPISAPAPTNRKNSHTPATSLARPHATPH